jgi:hypothetical protein
MKSQRGKRIHKNTDMIVIDIIEFLILKHIEFDTKDIITLIVVLLESATIIGLG